MAAFAIGQSIDIVGSEMYFEKECVLLLFMVEQDQPRTVLRELFVEYFSDSCKFSLHWKATSLYLLSSRLRQVVLEWLWMCD